MPLEHPSCSVHNESPRDDAVGVHSCKRARAPSEHRHSPVSPPLDDGPDNSCQFSGNTCKTIPVAQPVAAQESPNTSCPSKEPFILEICAGTARVTSCLQALGLTSSFGVDHKRLKNAGRVLVADLTTPEGQNLCWEWIPFFRAPPCGTCSRARGIPVTLPNGCVVAGPQPLRSDAFPDGLSSMSYLNRCRVKSANALYKSIAAVARYCMA